MVKQLDDDKKKKNRKIAKNLFIVTLICSGIMVIGGFLLDLLKYNMNIKRMFFLIAYTILLLVISILAYQISLKMNNNFILFMVVVFYAAICIYIWIKVIGILRGEAYHAGFAAAFDQAFQQ